MCLSKRKGRIIGKIHLSPGYSSGQRGVTVNHMLYGFVGSNPAPGTKERRCLRIENSLHAVKIKDEIFEK